MATDQRQVEESRFRIGPRLAEYFARERRGIQVGRWSRQQGACPDDPFIGACGANEGRIHMLEVA